MRYESAELAKISINIFLAASICTTNTVAEICEAVGADWMEIASTLRLDRRIGPYAYLVPGLGIAGGNIERDLVTIRSLAAEHGADDCVPASFTAHSRHRRDWVLRVLHRQVLSRQSRPVIAIWGLSYKPNTNSTKNSPTWALLDSLLTIPVQLYDPQATLDKGYPNVVQTPSALEACRGAHVLVIMTAWEEFASISARAVKEVMAQPIVIDPSAVWSHHELAAEGVTYSTLGRPVA
jgi:UDPglucose 6-dehydrogenase